MPKSRVRKTRNKNKQTIVSAQNDARGLISIAKDRSFKPGEDRRAVLFQQALKQKLLNAGKDLNNQNFEKHLAWLDAIKENSAPLVDKQVPSSYALMSSAYDLRTNIDFEHEIEWVLSRLQSNSQVITEFVKHSRVVEQAVLHAKPEEIERVLSEVRAIFGPSLWLAEAVVATTQWHHGLERQKKVSSDMRGKKRKGLFGYFLHLVSMRNEPSMTDSRFREVVRQRSNSFKAQSLRDYLLFKLTARVPLTVEEAGRILRIEESHSIVDLYETTLALLTRWVQNKSPTETKMVLRRARIKLAGIPDPRLARILVDATDDCAFDLLEMPLIDTQIFPTNMYKRYARATGEMCVLKNLQQGAIVLAGLRPEGIEVTSRSLWRHTMGHMANILTGKDCDGESFSQIQKLLSNFGFLPIYQNLKILLDAKPRSGIAPSRLHENLVNVIETRDSLILDLDDSRNDSSFSHDVTVEVLREIKNLYVDASDARLLLFLERSKKLNRASIPQPVLYVLDTTILRSLFLLERFGDALNKLSEMILVDFYDVAQLPLAEIFDGKSWSHLKKFRGEISLSICLDIYLRNGEPESADDIESMRRYAFEDFIMLNGVTLPSSLTYPIKSESISEFIYFMRFVCVPRTMELAPGLSGTKVLEQERIRVCSLLRTIDKENAPIYQSEILEIVNRHTIAEGVKLVDSSRLHVDVDAIRRQCNKEMKPDYARYKGLVQAGIGIAPAFDSVLRALLKDVQVDAFLKIPESEADDALLRIVNGIKEQFLFDAEHGLDSYLSRRIRHNSLTGQLRSPVDASRLVTLFDTEQNAYLENEFWLSKLSNIDPASLSSIGRYLRSFTQEFDAISKNLSSKVLHIASPDHIEGIFTLPLDARAFHMLRSLAQQVAPTLDDFITVCFRVFWVYLEPSLARARSMIVKDANYSLSECFDRLKAGVGSLVACPGISSLTAEIGRAQIEVSRQLVIIADWFIKREHQENLKTYTLDEALSICIDTCLTAHRAQSPIITRKVRGELPVQSPILFLLSDILWIAIDNACVRSGISKNNQIYIELSYEESSNLMSVRVENAVTSGSVDRHALARIGQIKEDIKEGRHRSGLRVEGRSGLKKLAAVAFKTEGGELDFGVMGQDKFFVQVTVKLELITHNIGGAYSNQTQEVVYYENSVG